MAAAPDKGLRFEIDGIKFCFGLVDGADFGWILVLAKEKSAGSNDYAWISQSQMNDLSEKQDATDEEINYFCQSALAQANRVLAEQFPPKDSNPSTPNQRVTAWVMGLQFDSTTNQIKRK